MSDGEICDLCGKYVYGKAATHNCTYGEVKPMALTGRQQELIKEIRDTCKGFNDMDPDLIIQTLKASPELWIGGEVEGDDTIYLYPAEGLYTEKYLALLGHAVRADEIDWEGKYEHRQLRLWWD